MPPSCIFGDCGSFHVKQATHARFIHVSDCCACIHACQSVKIIVTRYLTLLSNSDFFHHPKILHNLKATNKFRLADAHICKLGAHVCT